MPRLTSRKRQRLNDRGVTAVEFSILAPVFLLVVMGIIELSSAMFAWVTMESAVREASRFGITGYAEDGETREEGITRIMQAQSHGLLNPAKIVIDTLVYSQFDKIGQPEPYTDANANNQYDSGEAFVDVNGNGEWDPDMGATGAGDAGDVVIYRVTYPWQMFTPFAQSLFPNQGQITLSASMVVRNEPYDYVGVGQ